MSPAATLQRTSKPFTRHRAAHRPGARRFERVPVHRRGGGGNASCSPRPLCVGTPQGEDSALKMCSLNPVHARADTNRCCVWNPELRRCGKDGTEPTRHRTPPNWHPREQSSSETLGSGSARCGVLAGAAWGARWKPRPSDRPGAGSSRRRAQPRPPLRRGCSPRQLRPCGIRHGPALLSPALHTAPGQLPSSSLLILLAGGWKASATPVAPGPVQVSGGGHRAPEPPYWLSWGLAWQPATQSLPDAQLAGGWHWLRSRLWGPRSAPCPPGGSEGSAAAGEHGRDRHAPQGHGAERAEMLPLTRQRRNKWNYYS